MGGKQSRMEESEANSSSSNSSTGDNSNSSSSGSYSVTATKGLEKHLQQTNNTNNNNKENKPLPFNQLKNAYTEGFEDARRQQDEYLRKERKDRMEHVSGEWMEKEANLNRTIDQMMNDFKKSRFIPPTATDIGCTNESQKVIECYDSQAASTDKITCSSIVDIYEKCALMKLNSVNL